MTLFILIAIAFYGVALLCFLVPTHIGTVNNDAWVTAGLLAWVLDVATGGYVVNRTARAA